MQRKWITWVQNDDFIPLWSYHTASQIPYSKYKWKHENSSLWFARKHHVHTLNKNNIVFRYLSYFGHGLILNGLNFGLLGVRSSLGCQSSPRFNWHNFQESLTQVNYALQRLKCILQMLRCVPTHLVGSQWFLTLLSNQACSVKVVQALIDRTFQNHLLRIIMHCKS